MSDQKTDLPTQLSPLDLMTLRAHVAEARSAQNAVAAAEMQLTVARGEHQMFTAAYNKLMDNLRTTYTLQPDDQIGVDGAITRAAAK